MSLPKPLSRSMVIATAFILVMSSGFAAADLNDSINRRQEAIENLLSQGKVCELLSGYLREMTPLGPEEKAFADAENADRKNLYTLISGFQNKTPADPGPVGEERSTRYSERLRPGILREIIDASGQPRIWDGRDPDPRKGGKALRVVTIDGAAIHEQPTTESKALQDNLPRFSAYTVMKEQNGWYQVTSRSTDQILSSGTVALGWIDGSKCFPWNHSIVVEPNPLIGREPALFLEKNETLKEIAAIPDKGQRDGQMKALETSGNGVVAREPRIDYTTQERAFVMPVIAHESIEVSGRPVMLVEVGAATGGAEKKQTEAPPLDVVFVMDTTGSMGPYTDEVIKQVERMTAEIAAKAPNVNFGFIGYRDDEKKDPLMEYRTCNFTPELQSVSGFSKAIAKVKSVAKPLNDEIAEAMYDGVYDAIKGNWKTKIEKGIRIVVVIGDAPSHKMMNNGKSGEILRQIAADERVGLHAIFLKNGKSSKKETDDLAVAQLTELTRSNERGTGVRDTKPSLTVVDAKDVGGFGKAFSGTFESILKFVEGGKAGLSPTVNPSDASSFDLVLNNAYLNWVSSGNTAEPPSFIKGWTSDCLLQDPAHPAFSAKVMLNRKELQQLIRLVDDFLTADREKKTGKELFEILQRGAGATLVNPAALKLGDRMKLPADLGVLPYKSKILGLTEETWNNSLSGQEGGETMNELKAKLDWYKSLDEDKRVATKNDPSPVWKPLVVGATEEDYVCLLPLHMLP